MHGDGPIIRLLEPRRVSSGGTGNLISNKM